MTTNRPRLLATLAALAGVAIFANSALAQAPVQQSGFALDRFQPSERGSDWFALESLDLRGHLRPAIGLVGDYARKPLVIYDANGNAITSPVEDQLFLHVGGALNLWGRLRLAASLPVALHIEGTPGTINNISFRAAEGANIGDLRLGADVRVAGEYGDLITLAVGVQAHLPTGDRDAYTSDGQARIVPRVMLAGEAGAFTWAARGGVDLRLENGNFAGQPFGNELIFAAAAGLRLADRRLTIGPEVYGSTVMEDGGFFNKKSTPIELIGGFHYAIAGTWRIGAGAGPGIERALGTPAFRVLGSLSWFPAYEPPAPPPPPDRDGDGILDVDDACPDQPGERRDDPRTNGCPDRDGDQIVDKLDACPSDAGVATDDPKTHGCPDGDGDKIVDKLDACPTVPGVASEDPKKHGCPPDRDGDKIVDAQDACPDEPGVASEDPKKHGCPLPPDRDGDKIIDAEDACPDQPGDPDPDPKKNGCPKVVVVKGEIKILERIEFDTGKATIRPESEPVLNAVLRALKDNPEITKVRVEGHTDSRGNDKYNLKLSQKRVESVVAWLSERGIEPGRLVAQGFGESKPIASNKTAEGRQRNRRVQFIILEREGKPIEAGE